MEIVHVEQVDKSGCGLAISSMVFMALIDDSYTYARLREVAPRWCHEKCGAQDEDLFELFAEHGIAMQLRKEAREFDGQIKAKWPPKPWADIHVCSVYQTRDDWKRGDGHYVVMDRKGVVYDPADPVHVKCRLSRYYLVEWVAACFYVDEE